MTENVPAPGTYATTGQARIDRWTFSVGHGFRTVDVFCSGLRETVQFFLDRGWGAAVIPMPGHTTDIHNALVDQEAGDSGFVRVFLEGSAFTVGHARTLGYRTFAMVGLSGGGWTTNVYSAIDVRIRYSASVAGSLPTWIRWPTIPELGDYEQRDRPMYQLVSYEDLYYLAARSGRRQTQILNEDDPCCFASRPRHAEIERYAAEVQDRLLDHGEGGIFRVVFDGTHTDHRVSAYALSEIEADLADMGLVP